MPPIYKHFGDRSRQVFRSSEIPAEFTRGAKHITSDQGDGGYGDWHHHTLIWDGRNFHHYTKYGPGSTGESDTETSDDPWARGNGELEEHHARTVGELNRAIAPAWHQIGKVYGDVLQHASHVIPETHRKIKLPGQTGVLMRSPAIAADEAEESGFPKMAKVLRNVKAGPLKDQFQEHRMGKSADGAVHFFGPGYHWIHSKHLV